MLTLRHLTRFEPARFASALRLFAAIACVLTVAASSRSYAAKGDSWTALFNGQNLDGWYTYLDDAGKNADPGHVFQVEDGVIHLYKDHPDGVKAPKGYFASQVEYANYHLRFQYKFGTKKFPPRYDTKRDAGLLYHITGPDKVWPRCFECQVQEGDTGDCLTVQGTRLQTTVDPKPVRTEEFQVREAKAGGVEKTLGGLRNIRFMKEGVHDRDGWNTVELIVNGNDECLHIVNGHPTFHGKNLGKLAEDDKTWQPLAAGRIAFQAECAEVFYRNIEIQSIEGKPLKATNEQTASESANLKNQGQAPETSLGRNEGAPATVTAPSTRLPTVPEGFEIEIAAGPPLVDYPMMACFDDEGRLYVSEGANVNDEYRIVKDTLPRSIRRLEDTDGDGKFDKVNVFADKMVFPYGGTWHNGSLYVASDPTVWKLTDTDGDGVCDKREVVVTGFQASGHGACMKGGYLGLDGYMYFTGGNEQGGFDLKDKDGTRLYDPSSAPCVFRIRPDGTGLEHFANGAAGVYDITFDPSGDLFGVVTILRYPRGDGLMYWVYGGAYQSSRPVSAFARFTGEVLPALKEWPQSSPSGALLYQSDAFGKEYRGNIFGAHFGTHVVTRDVIKRDGAAWKVEQEENFAQSDNLNCRFTDVLEDGDGSLLLVNTGGWFRIGCPSAEVGESDLRGAIYRVRKVGQKSVADGRGTKLNWKNMPDLTMANLMGDGRTPVRDHAVAEFARRGARSVPALRSSLKNPSPLVRCNAVWAMTRIGDAEARAGVREALAGQDLTTTLAALHSIGTMRDKDAYDQLVHLLVSKEPAIRREAATALGRLGNPACVPTLLEMVGDTSDRFMEQALIYAMIEIDSSEPLTPGLTSSNPKIQRGAMLALEQMAHGNLPQSEVGRLLQSDDLPLQTSALDVIGRHRGWSKGLVEYLTKQLAKPGMTDQQTAIVSRALRSAVGDRGVQELIAKLLSDPNMRTETRVILLGVVGGGKATKFPSVWQKPLEQCLLSSDETTARRAIDWAARFARSNFSEVLKTVALDAKRPTPVRLAAAVTAAPATSGPLDDQLFQFLLENCASQDTEVVGQLTIAQALGNSQLSPAQLAQMTQTVAVVGPLQLPSLIKAYEEAAEPTAGKELFAALKQSPGLTSLSAARVQRLIDRYPKSLQRSAADLLQKFAGATESQSVRMKELEFALTGGDPVHGQDLFAGKAACSQCHKVNGKGAGVGPELTEIGTIRTRRDLIEAVAFPSATFARGYEPMTIIASGRTYTGIIRGETAREVSVLTPGRAEIQIPRDEIEEILPCPVSVMPQGLDRNLTNDELRDVIAFLSSLKAKK